VHPARPSYEAGDAVEIDVVAANVSDEPVLCHCALALGSLEVEYRRDGERFRRLDLGERHPEMLPLYRLEKNEAVKQKRWLSYDPRARAPLFDLPGRYELRLTYYDSEQHTRPCFTGRSTSGIARTDATRSGIG
jgi:hypothetical protein